MMATSTKNAVHVLYGSETGNAEELAFALGKAIRTSGFAANVCSLQSFPIVSMFDGNTASVVIFVVSTTGEGDPPQSMRLFWRSMLRKSIPPTSLRHLQFAVFGLGDTAYEKFNAVARKLVVRLKQLGGNEILDIGYGDDQAAYGYYSAYIPWMRKLLSAGLPQFKDKIEKFSANDSLSRNGTSSDGYIITTILPSANKTTTATAKAETAILESMSMSEALGQTGYNTWRVLENTRLTNRTWNQDVRHIRLAPLPSTAIAESTKDNANSYEEGGKQSLPTKGYEISPHHRNHDYNLHCFYRYEVGDIAEVHYRNNEELVRRALAAFKLRDGCLNRLGTFLKVSRPSGHSNATATSTPTLAESDNKPPPPPQQQQQQRSSRIKEISTPCTLSYLLSSILNIGAIPQRSFFELLAEYATDEDEKEKLLELSSAEGTDLYFDYCVNERRSYVEVMEEFHSAKPPLEKLLEVIPTIPARQYSIASSPTAHPNEVHLCVAVTQHKTRYGRERTGLCTGYLRELNVGDPILIRLKPGSLRTSKLLSTLYLSSTPTYTAALNTALPTSLPSPYAAHIGAFSSMKKPGLGHISPVQDLNTTLSTTAATLTSPSTTTTTTATTTQEGYMEGSRNPAVNAATSGFPLTGILASNEKRRRLNPSATLILVGPGTGVAPMRSILFEMTALSGVSAQITAENPDFAEKLAERLDDHGITTTTTPNNNNNNNNNSTTITKGTECETAGIEMPNVYLFFGCRKRAEDYLYGEEWEALSDRDPVLQKQQQQQEQQQQELQLKDAAVSTTEGALLADPAAISTGTLNGTLNGNIRVVTAFSQDQQRSSSSPPVLLSQPQRKVYVTDKILEHGVDVWRMMQKEDSCIFIAGSAKKMPQDVRKALLQVAVTHGQLSRERAEELLRQKARAGRYIVEAWS